MKISIFKTLRLRLKRWLGHVEFLGRARRQAATRLTLPDLEREVRAYMGAALTAKSRPPRFAALRYTFFGDRGLAPWVTEKALQAQYAKSHNDKTDVFPFLSVPYGLIGIFSAFTLGGFILKQDTPIVGFLVFLIGLVSGLGSLAAFRDRGITVRRYLRNTSQGEVRDESVPSVQSPMSAGITRYVAHRLEGVKEELVGKGTVHTKTRERADSELREARAKWTQLHLRIRQRYGEGISDDASVELTNEQVPTHLRVLREELRLILRRAEDTLHQLDKFESNITAALDELGAEARADLVLYEDLDLIEGVRRLGGRVEQTARDARHSIAQALESLQERMDALRVDVLRREELIGGIVAALPRAPDRDAEWRRLEDVVSGLSSPQRQKTLA